MSKVTMDGVASRLRQLNAQREALEVEAMAISTELESPGVNGEPPAGVKSPLVDAEGYPRADVDVFNVRTKRNRLAIINTDHMALMKDIERELANYHQLSAGVAPISSSSISGNSNSSSSSSNSSKPPGPPYASRSVHHSSAAFATFDEVLDQSPAHEAGIEIGDELLAFGPTICSETPDALNCIPAFMGLNVNKPIEIQVRRAQELLLLTLTPKAWGGRGLLGCHLKPKV